MLKAGLKQLIESFSDVDVLPVEVETIRQRIIDLGFQDEIYIVGGVEDPGKIRGVYYQFTKRNSVYEPPTLVTIVGYNKSLSIEWQRVAACKELIHIFDKRIELTKTEEEVAGLIDKLLGPLSTDDLGVADFMALRDKVALYQCLPLLLPQKAREICVDWIRNGRTTPETVAEVACIPLSLCELVLSKEWPELITGLLDC